MLESAVRDRERANPLGFVLDILLNVLIAGLKLSWTIVTLFVIPAMVYKDLGPFEAIKDSTQAIKKTWGESLVRSYGLGFIQFFVLLIGVGALVLLGMALSSALGMIVVGLAIAAYVIVVFAVFSMVNTVFNTALYAYAATGEVPKGFSRDVLENAFRSK